MSADDIGADGTGTDGTGTDGTGTDGTGTDDTGVDGVSTDRPTGLGGESSDPNDPDGQMDDQDMPTTDGQMASNTSEEVIPPRE